MFMDSQNTYWHDRALLEWQVELGATDAILDAPIDRYALETAKPAPISKPAEPVAHVQMPPAEVDPVAIARAAANVTHDLPSLAAAMQSFAHCDLKQGARNFVFADGQASARVMIIGDPPGRDEDRDGKPFVGRAGQLLDRMLAAIDMDRGHKDPSRAVYLTNVIPWRPAAKLSPDASEIAMLLPFLERHIALVNPDVIVLMGNVPCQLLLGRSGVLRMRGTWVTALGKPCLPMVHPEYLLKTPLAKREAWADLLSLKAKLKT